MLGGGGRKKEGPFLRKNSGGGPIGEIGKKKELNRTPGEKGSI